MFRPNSLVLWLWFPLSCLTGWIIFEQLAPKEIVSRYVSENGPIEWAQIAVIFAGFLTAVRILTKIDFKKYQALTAWFVIAMLGCFYITGEEISWGQWLFYWDTPETWKAVNDQGETNLHNTSSWLDQKPRLLIEFGLVLSCLILPLVDKIKSGLLPQWLKIILPPANAAFMGGIYLFVKLTDKLSDYTSIKFYLRGSETLEFFIYYFVMAYILNFNIEKYSKNPKKAEKF